MKRVFKLEGYTWEWYPDGALFRSWEITDYAENCGTRRMCENLATDTATKALLRRVGELEGVVNRAKNCIVCAGFPNANLMEVCENTLEILEEGK